MPQLKAEFVSSSPNVTMCPGEQLPEYAVELYPEALLDMEQSPTEIDKM